MTEKLEKAQKIIKKYNLKGKQKKEILKLANKMFNKQPKEQEEKPIRKVMRRSIVRKLECKKDFEDAINELKSIMEEIEGIREVMPPKKGIRILKTQIKEAKELHIKLKKVIDRFQAVGGYGEIKDARRKDLLLNIISGSFSASYHHFVKTMIKSEEAGKKIDKESVILFLEIVIASAILAYKEINNIK